MMKNFKRGIYLMAGLAYMNNLWERMRTEGWLSYFFKNIDTENELSVVDKSAVCCILIVLGVIFWPFVLVLDFTTKWDKPTK